MIGSLIGGAAKIAGGIIQGNQSVKAQKLANASNEKIARENNQWQRENMQMQNDWNIEQWNRENEYNSASAQAQRFREAGLNPYLAMTGGANAGSASSVTSADAGHASEVGKQMPIDYSAYNGVLNTLSELPMQIAQAENFGASTDKQQAEADVARATAEQLGIENFYKSKMMRLTTEKMIQDLDIGESYKKQMRIHLDDMERENSLLNDHEVFNARKQQYIQGVRLTASSVALNEINKSIADKHYKWFDKMKQAEFSNIVANTSAAIAAANLSRKQAKLVSEQTALAAFDNMIRGKMSVKDAEQLKRAMVGTAVGACNQAIGEGKFSLYRGNNAASVVDSQIDQGWVNAGANVIGAGANAANAWSNLPTNNTEASYEQLTHRYTQDGYTTTRSSKRTRGKK